MNVFVLSTGRAGSTSFYRAAQHITNYTAAHESRAGLVGNRRLTYPPNHIEADNRLSWMLGRLQVAYGDDAFYVHLRRNDLDTAASFVKRWGTGIIRAYAEGILIDPDPDLDRLDIAADYCTTVNRNIEAFLVGKSHRMDFELENAAHHYATFWDRIGAEGDREAALAEWDTRHNASDQVGRNTRPTETFQKLVRIARKFPQFARDA